MKKIYTLSSLLEQTDLESAKIELTGSAVTMTKADKVRIKWPYLYSWPAKSPLLGDIANFVRVLNAGNGKGGKDILSQIKQADPTHVIGIATDAESTQANRLLRKDLGQLKGFVYLFYPDTIDTKLVPAAKQLEKVDGKFTFVVDAEWQKYLVTAAPAADATAAAAKTEPKPLIGANSFLESDGVNRDWYTNTAYPLISPVRTALEKTLGGVTITQSGKPAGIFWQFMTAVPTHSWALDMPADSSNYTELLQNKIKLLLAEAAKFDKTTFTAVDTNNLNAGLYGKMAQALIVIGLNKGELTNKSTADSAPEYFKPLTKAKAQSDALLTDKAAIDDAGKAGKATDGFDGTAINNEMDLAKIISGGLIGYKVPATEVDTLDKIKAKWDSYIPSTYEKKFSEIVAKLPFKQNNTNIINLTEFKDVQFFAIGINGKFGPKTVAGFKSAFEKSALK